MRNISGLLARIFVVLVCTSFLCGCGTIVKLPMHPQFYSVDIKKLPYTVLISYPAEFDQTTYQTSQLGSTWVYPVASTTKELIHNSMLNYFHAVGISDSGIDEGTQYDLIIYPKIEKFVAKVPSTVFSPTKTEIRLVYDYVIPGSQESKSVQITATEEVDSFIGESAFKDMSEKEKTLGAGYGALADIPQYGYRAARDGVVAIAQATYGLSAKLHEELRQNR